MTKKLISICVPVFNEESNIEPLILRLGKLADKLQDKYRFEFLFTDNHSEDETYNRLNELATGDTRIRVIRFSRNFGFQRSILFNYLNARGEAAIQIDCDLQDPPEMIEEFLEYWEQGYKVVYGVRRDRPNESPLLFGMRKFFYTLLDKISDHPIPRNAGDFRLVDRCVLEELTKISPYQPYLRGAIATFGYKQIGVTYDRSARERGVSKFSFIDLLRLAIDGIVSHSINPLRVATYAGFGSFMLAILGGIYYLVAKLFVVDSWPEGLASSSILMLFSIGLNGMFLGLIGEYISRMYRMMLGGSFVLVESKVDPQPVPDEEMVTSDAETR